MSHAILHLQNYKYLENQLPKAKNGLIDAYKDIIPALIKQKTDPNYSIEIKLNSNEKVSA